MIWGSIPHKQYLGIFGNALSTTRHSCEPKALVKGGVATSLADPVNNQQRLALCGLNCDAMEEKRTQGSWCEDMGSWLQIFVQLVHLRFDWDSFGISISQTSSWS